ncbi:hypothetical protein MPRM_00030 [Mycobacterium parmense]|uniref:Uncharacterized protein n=1 Tax=Mycobacterium parmense TaxID=185642 RepID=A0A7I7YNL5_9MYCO|nr:hypothetical protein MPRM_00030 [Mycobacterium parmense]
MGRSNNAEVLRTTRLSHSTPAPGSSSRAPMVSLPLRLTAMVRSAFTAEGAIGAGRGCPPSASRRPSISCGAITPGIAMDARIASSTGPRWNHTDFPANRSVATAV